MFVQGKEQLFKSATFSETTNTGGLIQLGHPERKIVAIEIDQNYRIGGVVKLNALSTTPNAFLVYNIQGAGQPYTLITMTSGTTVSGKYWYFE